MSTQIPIAGYLSRILGAVPERVVLDRVTPSHPGLALDRYLPFDYQPRGADDRSPWAFDSQQKGPWLREFVRVANRTFAETHSPWRSWARRHVELMTSWPGAMRERIRPRWRWVVGLGTGTVLETGITLHHTYGVPYIPGSSLKGLTQALVMLRQEPKELTSRLLSLGRGLGAESDADAHKSAARALFGETDPGETARAGEVVFLGAIPHPDAPPRLKVDVMTPHFPGWYGGRREAPLEVEDPTPIPFLVVGGGDYEIGIAVRRRSRPGGDELVRLAMDLCLAALDELGVGGKTAKGYGYFHPAPEGGFRRR